MAFNFQVHWLLAAPVPGAYVPPLPLLLTGFP